MNKMLRLSVAFAGVFTIGFLAINTTLANSSGASEVEQRVNANLLRVKVNGEWHEVPMVELSDRLCDSDHQMFRRYCD